MSDLAGLVAMSAPSVVDRARHLGDLGLLLGFTIGLDLKVMGYALQALIGAQPSRGQLHLIEQMIQEMLECDKVTVEDSYTLSLCVRLTD
jgi:Lrp/AsnC family leucine-responsive transcriptional regulator